ncbi:HUTI imidazolonepropionase, partial [Polyodon spathula]|nr:HUTI imidazolonepropionase [Polyodon spathula]
MCVTPGLKNAHTHPVWAGDRVHEFAMKVPPAWRFTRWWGGIHFTVEHTRQASEAELLASLKLRLLRMLRTGTTLVDCKSGYGLELDTEVKMLSVIERARKDLPIGISPIYCRTHSVPK